MRDVHGIAALPDMAVPDLDGPTPTGGEPAREFVADYFDEYEQRFALSVLRPVRVSRVESAHDLLRVPADSGSWLTRTIVNATGTWDQPFIPYYPGIGNYSGPLAAWLVLSWPELREALSVRTASSPAGRCVSWSIRRRCL